MWGVGFSVFDDVVWPTQVRPHVVMCPISDQNSGEYVNQIFKLNTINLELKMFEKQNYYQFAS